MNSTKHYMLILGCLAAFAAPQSNWACTFCPPDLTASLLKEVDSASTAVLAELVRLPEPNDKSAVSTYRVTVTLKGDVAKGTTIVVPLDVKSPLGTIHLFLGDENKGTWGNPRGVSSQARSFLELVTKLPAADQKSLVEDRARRLAFMLPYLISKDRQVANSVYGEFAAAPDSVVRQLEPILNHRKLSAWIELEPVSPKHRRLMFTLLRVCGDASDLPFVEAALDDRLNRNETFELDAIIATYLALAGSEGLDEIDRRLLSSDDVSLTTYRALANALRFHVDSDSVIGKERLVASCRRLLDDPQTADYVLRDLARWKDWESLDDVLQLQQRAGEKRWLKTAIDDYLKKCPLPKSEKGVRSQ